MKAKYIIGNWKSNKNATEVEAWFSKFRKQYSQNRDANIGNVTIILCIPFIYLPLAKKIKDNYGLPLRLGAQDISPFADGAYTGEISARMLREYVEYVLIGHSERRKYFLENDDILAEKVRMAKEANMSSIYCVQDEKTYIPEGVNIIAYEPVWAIGTGKTDTPQNADRVAKSIKMRKAGNILIYGGSVSPENIKSFFQTENINGVLPGGSSLDPVKFWEMIVNATTN